MKVYTEKRAHERVATTVVAEHMLDVPGKVAIPMEGRNIGIEGMKVLSTSDLLPGEKLKVVFYLPNSETRTMLDSLLAKNIIPRDINFAKDRIEAKAKVIWAGGTDERPGRVYAGLLFEDMSIRHKNILRSFISKCKNGEL
ncbi:MAG TPA: PilZ domain-containing protein [Candidatus Omnitrophota bacterium]|nr:PilZ domain-containing protein [Candidatus Omnitrophota bacterium]